MKLGNKRLLKLSICAAILLQMPVLADSTKQNNKSLGTVDVVSSSDSENTNSYTVNSMNTATKLNLSLRQTPQSVSVLTTQKMRDLGINSYDSMLNNVTGVSLNRWDERVNASARGFDLDYYKIDGMPTYITYNARDLDLSLYDRVEVVRGANGLTTGAGNPALSINLVRKRANSNEFKGDIFLRGGSWDSYSAMTDISTPLNSDKSIRARIIAKHEDSKSFMDNYEKENNLFYGVVDMNLTDTTFLSVGASYQKLDRKGIRWGGLPAFYSDNSKTNFDRSKTVSEDWTAWDVETKSLFANLEQILYKDISLNLAYTYDEIKTDTALLYFAGKVNKADGSGLNYMDWKAQEEKKQNTLDINVKVPFEVANLSQEIIVGATYSKDKTLKYDAVYPQGYYSTLPNFYDYNLDFPSSSSADVPYIIRPEDIVQKGIYLAGNFSLTNSLKLIAGARLSSWEYNSEDSNKETRKFDNEITPYVGLVYDIDKNHSLYTSYTSIFQPQDKKDRSDNFLEPIEGKNYEIGVKGEYFNGKLTSSLAIFRIEQDNVAQTDGDPIGGKQPYKSSEGVTSKGVEFDISGQVTDNLTLDFGIANFEARDADGEKFNTKASRTTANLFAKYTINNLRLGAGLNYKSKYYTQTDSGKITQDAYTLANAMIGYKINKNANLQLNINNIFDKKYYEGIGKNSMVYGTPRRVLLTLQYSF
ncbi:TonB-dependent siderophore receptor [Malaciobacter mytili]|uniref:TonB-dependent siderophore receptor n=1 Tax=Malaciobacter mytili TaxID=603050 RepID=UPI003BAF8AD6